VVLAIGLFERIPNAVVAFIARGSIAAVFWNSGQARVEGFALGLVSGEFALGWPRLSESALALPGMSLVIQVFVHPGAHATHGTWAALLLYLMARRPPCGRPPDHPRHHGRSPQGGGSSPMAWVAQRGDAQPVACARGCGGLRLKTRQQLQAFLLRHGRRYPGRTNGTKSPEPLSAGVNRVAPRLRLATLRPPLTRPDAAKNAMVR
jgi:putative oxidoreductase